MQPLPSITVVTPSFNQGDFIERTIQSVLRQDYPFLEYVVVDACSTDQSVEIIRKYAGRLHWWCSESDDGQADAIAKGFAHSTGDILCWLNSDDVFLPGALGAVGEYFRTYPDVEVINGASYCIDAMDSPIRHPFTSTYTHGVCASATRLRFYGQDGVYQPATFWRRNAYDAVGGVRTQFKFAMDLDLFVRLAARQRFQVVRKYLACFRIHSKAKSTQNQHVRDMEVQLLRREYGVYNASLLLRVFLQSWYRLISLIRKLFLQLRLLTGGEQFPVARVVLSTVEKHDAAL